MTLNLYYFSINAHMIRPPSLSGHLIAESYSDVCSVVFAHLELFNTRSPFSIEGTALAQITKYKAGEGRVRSGLPLYLRHPHPPFIVTVIDEPGCCRDMLSIKQQWAEDWTKIVHLPRAGAGWTLTRVTMTKRDMGCKNHRRLSTVEPQGSSTVRLLLDRHLKRL